MPFIVAIMLIFGMGFVFANPYEAQGYIMVLAAAGVGLVGTVIRSDRRITLLREELFRSVAQGDVFAAEVLFLRQRNAELERLARFSSGPSPIQDPHREVCLARLGFPSGYDPDNAEIRAARARAIKAAHPDLSGHEAYAGEVLMEIDRAAKALSE